MKESLRAEAGSRGDEKFSGKALLLETKSDQMPSPGCFSARPHVCYVLM